jgi:hypothetical protein
MPEANQISVCLLKIDKTMKISKPSKNNNEQTNTKRQHPSLTSIVAMMAFTLSLSVHSVSQTLPGKPYSLFGNPECSEWAEMNAESRLAWTSGFLSTLSMGHETSRRLGEQKFKDLQGLDKVVTAINKHCVAHPDAQASEAAAPFLNP